MYLSGWMMSIMVLWKKNVCAEKEDAQSWLQYPAKKLDRVNSLSSETTWKPARLWTTTWVLWSCLRLSVENSNWDLAMHW